ncbi:MAG: hypothetical protein QNJ72_32095 [Pleurocapsa sp. MO_226.B13]|nr:hypothetical protein [Pleurocapsa sp. MO_226.B13]
MNKDIRISGDVEIHPTASLAPGVILQAAPDCRIVIGADVCIGMGVIINACIGSIEIDTGAILGSGVLIVGASKIGNNACIGTAVTIFQADVEAMKVIEPGSVLGDTSRKLNLAPDNQEQNNAERSSSPSPSNTSQQNGAKASSKDQPSVKKTAVNNHQQDKNTTPTAPAETVRSEIKKDKDSVVGQVYINQLLVTLFPHKKNLESNPKKLE